MGVRQILGRDPTPKELEKIEYLRAAKGPSATAGEIVGDLGTLAVPGTAVAKGARALTRAPGLKRALASIGGESALVGGYEAGKLPSEDDSRLGSGLQGGALTALTGGALGVAGAIGRGVLAPRRFPKSAEALRLQEQRRAAGQSEYIPLFQAVGKDPKGVHAKLTRGIHRKFGPMFAGNKMRQQIGESDTAMRDTMFKKSLPEGVDIPLSGQRAGAEAPVQDTVKGIRDFYSGEYGRLIDPLNIPVQGPVFTKVVGAAPKKAQKRIKDLIETSKKEGVLPGANVKKVQSELRNFARSPKALPSEKEAYWAVDDVLEQTIQRRLASRGPEFLEDYQRLAAPYRNFLTVEDAAYKAAEQSGEFSAKHLVRAAKQKKGQPRSVVAAGEGPLQQEATRELKVAMPLASTDSPFLELATWGALTGAVPGMAGGAGAAVPIPLGFAAQTVGSMTKRGQKYLMSEYPWQQRVGKRLDDLQPQFERQRAIAGRLAGTQGTD